MVALHLGASVALFVLAKAKWEAILSGIALAIASFAIIMGISDNGILAAGTVFAFLPFVAWNSRRSIVRYFIALSTFVTGIIVTAQITIGRATMADCDGGSVFVTIGKTTAGIVLMIAVWTLTVILMLAFRKAAGQEEKIARYAKRVWAILVALGMVAVLAVFIDANRGNHADIWAPYQNILIFNDTWGTGRGINWRFAWEYFTKEAGLLKKLIGNGPDTYYIITMDYFKHAMREAGYGIFDSAHNEYLEYLTTIGILGTLAYLGIIVTSLRQMFRNPKNRFAITCGFAVLAYAVQAIVNIAIPITTPILMMLIYVGISIVRRSENGKTKIGKAEKESYEI